MNRWCFLVVLSCSAAWGGEGVRIPSGSTATVTMDKAGATVRYPFGKVEIPRASVLKEKTEWAPLGTLHARTQGSFRVSYVLRREGDFIVARTARVQVENTEEYFSPATEKLREHEAMHRRINEAEAVRIERVLGSFRTSEDNAAKAEEQFKAEFRQQIDAVKRLHAQWDENHVFIQTSTDTPPDEQNPTPRSSEGNSPLSGGESWLFHRE
jgi:hypothetical protein